MTGQEWPHHEVCLSGVRSGNGRILMGSNKPLGELLSDVCVQMFMV